MHKEIEMQRNESWQSVSQKSQKPLLEIIQDTRETLPISFDGFRNVTVIRKKLDTGDYSISGYEDLICFERKAINDTVGTLISNHSRFLREMERMKNYKEKYILIEHSPAILYSYCVKHGWENKFNTIIQSLLAYAYHYQCRVRFCKDREDMAAYIVRKSREFINGRMSSVPQNNDTGSVDNQAGL